ncbi:Pentapeptide repeat-containing protein [Selenomonas sp. GACV-9]|uniref:pentapeptide repeat-containing protein n=1 Tax=Selenomonas sp. GACV-9 TaxID=3158782 RepID=UPI0008E8A0BD|nr:Pentapeptide repeat-containing protein [Selenomonas ruminantium]
MKYCTIKDFYKNIYLPLEEKLLIDINDYCIENQQAMQEEYIGWLYKVVHASNIAKYVPLERLHCTMLYTDIFSGNASMSCYVYDAQGSIMTVASLSCLWIMNLWQDFEKQICDEREYIRSVIHPVMFRCYYPSTIRKVLAVLGEYLKVWLALNLDKIMTGILLTSEFYVTYGEYQGEQEVIGRLRSKVNLLKYIGQDNLPDDELRYRFFSDERYRVRKLGELDLQNSKFKDCLFEPWKFENTDLQNVVFDNCRFHLTEFRKVDLDGAIFINCSFDMCCFQSVQADGRLGRYPALFVNCSFSDLNFVDCDWIGVDYIDCEFTHAKMINSKLDGGVLNKIGIEGCSNV